jgi:hypothetical protein
MKHTITFKTPDALREAMDECPNDDERANLGELANDYIAYGEYVNVEFDTTNKTVTVLPT